MCSDHSKFTTGGSVSNHHLGPRVTSRRSTGRSSARRARARGRDRALQARPPIRPNEIGSPFAINGPGYFTDAAHQNHLHVGFKEGDHRLDYHPPPTCAPPAPRPRRGRAVLVGAPPPPATAPAPPLRSGARPRSPRSPRRPEPSGPHTLEFMEAVAAAARPRRRPRPGRPRGGRRARRPRTPRRPASAPDDAYPGDDAPREEIAAWMAEGREARAAARAARHGGARRVRLKNLNFGDADSVGFFQMRLSIWNQGAYAAIRTTRAADRLVPRPGRGRQAPAAGPRPADRRPNQFGEWIADVERPAEQYRGRYQAQARRRPRACSPRRPHAPPPVEADAAADASRGAAGVRRRGALAAPRQGAEA